MKIMFRGRNIEVTEEFKDYAIKRMARLDKFVDEGSEAQITLLGRKNVERVEITIPANGFILRGEEESDDAKTSLDLVLDKLEKQIVKTKERFSKKGRTSISRLDVGAYDLVSPVELDEIKVRYKSFSTEPMTIDEAITRMEMVGHSFFVFVNIETKATNVVYLRKDGNYGLLEPEE